MLNANKNSEIKDKIANIVDKLIDSDYYKNKYMAPLANDHLLEILYYYKNYFFESKINEIKIIEKILKNEIVKKIDYSKDYEEAKNMNYRFPIILYLFDIKLEKGKLNISEKDISQKFKIYESHEKSIKDKTYEKMKPDLKRKLLNYFMDENNKNILNKIFKEQECKDFINANAEKLSFKEKNKKIGNQKSYELNEQNDINEKKKMEGNSNLITSSKDKTSLKISPSKSKYINISEDLQKEESNIIVQSIFFQESSSMIYFNNNNNKTELTENEKVNEEIENILNIDTDYIDKGANLFKKSSKYKIVEVSKKIGNHQMSDLVKNIGKGRYLSAGTNKKIRIYDEYFEKKLEIDMVDWVYDIIEIESDNETEIRLLSCCNNYTFYFIINSENFKYKYFKYKIVSISSKSILKSENGFIIMGDAGIYNIHNIFEKNNDYIQKYQISKSNFRGGTKINEYLYAFTSNSILPNGEDFLIIYNTRSKIIVKSIEKYSFIVSSNGLCLIDTNINKNNKILLCACRKYNSGQKNGILLIELQLNNNNNKYQEFFYDTECFQVNCFCQICDVKNENAMGDDITKKENIKIKKTNFVLVGGYDEDRGEGVIKLYKIKENFSKILNLNLMKTLKDLIIL